MTQTEILFSSLSATSLPTKSYTSCLDAFTTGNIHPEPGKPVTIKLLSGSLKNCTMENILGGTKSCPVGWYGNADQEFCFQVQQGRVSNEEACRWVWLSWFKIWVMLWKCKITHHFIFKNITIYRCVYNPGLPTLTANSVDWILRFSYAVKMQNKSSIHFF